MTGTGDPSASTHGAGSPPNDEDAKSYPAIIDVTEVLNRQTLTGFNLRLVFLAFLITTTCGFELGTSALAGPDLEMAWEESWPDYGTRLGGLLLAGFFIPTTLGYLADRFGRKPVIVAVVLASGLASSATLVGLLLHKLVLGRGSAGVVTVIGIAFAGILPGVVSLVNEWAPHRARATLVVLILVGVAFGGGLRGLIGTNVIVPGGPGTLIWFGGLTPLAIALVLPFALPESVKYLAWHPARRDRLIRLLKQIDNALRIGPETRFIVSGESNKRPVSAGALFDGPLAVLTPLYWMANFTVLLSFSFTVEWWPRVLLSSGLPVEQANFAIALLQFGGALAGLLVMRLLDKFGYWPVPALFACAIAVLLGAGVADVASAASVALTSAAWFCLLGAQFCNIATEANIYPTSMRGFGVGLNFAVARVGSGLALLLFGIVPFELYLPLPGMIALALAALMVGLIAASLIALRYRDAVESS